MTDAKASSLTFTRAELAPAGGRPAPLALAALLRQVRENATSVPSEPGGGQCGHLGTVMPAAQHDTLPGAAARGAPAHPGAQAAPPAGAAAIQITQANRQHDKAEARFKLHHEAVACLKQQTLAAVDDQRASALQGSLLLRAQASPVAILQHLLDTYSTVTEEALEKNREAIAAEWSPDAGAEIIFTRATAAQQLALAAGAANALSDRTAIYLAIKAIERSGVFNDPCSTWRALTDAEQNSRPLSRWLHSALGRNVTAASLPSRLDMKPC